MGRSGGDIATPYIRFGFPAHEYRPLQRFKKRYEIGDILRIQLLQPTVARIAYHIG